jgi:hypothetical protein
MDSGKGSKTPKKQTELQQVARQYNSLLWQLKGLRGSLGTIKYRLPTQGLMITPPLATPPGYYENKLTDVLVEAENLLDYIDYLLRQLSESHRNSIKYTDECIKEKQNDTK